MADLFVNPNLPNYFVSAPDVTSATTDRSFVSQFESAKVITFPNLDAAIDHDFWAALDTGKYPALRKFGAQLLESDARTMQLHREALVARGVDDGLINALCAQFETIYRALLPVYEGIFAGYEFTKRKVVWRLNTIRNENMHLDVYAEENNDHFARMFVNLDNQPRIWQTSWTIDDLMEKLRDRFPPSAFEGKTRAQIWSDMSFSLFGPSPKHWWDDQPRHVAYFDPGDVWIVDSRQIAHQIFYGRRALSIDFSVKRESMGNPDRHYLSFVDRFREMREHTSA